MNGEQVAELVPQVGRLVGDYGLIGAAGLSVLFAAARLLEPGPRWGLREYHYRLRVMWLAAVAVCAVLMLREWPWPVAAALVVVVLGGLLVHDWPDLWAWGLVLRWKGAALAVGLGVQGEKGPLAPRLGRVLIGPLGARLEYSPWKGKLAAQVDGTVETLAQLLGVASVSVVEHRTRLLGGSCVVLELRRDVVLPVKEARALMPAEWGDGQPVPALDHGAIGLPRLSLVGREPQTVEAEPLTVADDEAVEPETAAGRFSSAVETLEVSRLRDRSSAPAPARSWRQVLQAVEVGTMGMGSWSLRVVDRHTLVVGWTGAGKSSVIWSLVYGLAPGIVAGAVEVWGLDPKRLELRQGRQIFERYARERDEMIGLLEEAVTSMYAREALIERRQFEPSVKTPLVVIVIDELLALVDMVRRDRNSKYRLEDALNALLIMGRAYGFVVVGCSQDARVSELDIRDKFNTRIGLRMPRNWVDLTLGAKAWEQGAHCEAIPETAPGTGYVISEGRMVPQLVRASWVSDDVIEDVERKVLALRGRPVSDQREQAVSSRTGVMGRPAQVEGGVA